MIAKNIKSQLIIALEYLIIMGGHLREINQSCVNTYMLNINLERTNDCRFLSADASGYTFIESQVLHKISTFEDISIADIEIIADRILNEITDTLRQSINIFSCVDLSLGGKHDTKNLS